MRDKSTDKVILGDWNGLDEEWYIHHGRFSVQSIAKRCDYISCAYVYLDPAQINEMLAAERERCISACENEGKSFETPEYAGGKSNAWGELFAVSECIKAIRNLGTAQKGLDDETRS